MFEGIFQPMHLFVIIGLARLMFGSKKLPEVSKGIGEGFRGFKSAINDRADEQPSQLADREGQSYFVWQASAANSSSSAAWAMCY